ncbi:MAG TPA: porin [Rhizobacter sp.]|nr:porin [Rhizobacter sp.]
MNSLLSVSGRSLLAASALAACASGAYAQSSVTAYGILSVDGVYASNVASGGEYRLENGRLNPSRLGFKGSEDLGGGLAAVFDIESGINPDTGTTQGAFWNRGAYVGLSSKSLGTLTFGRQWNVNDDLLGDFFIFGGYAVFSYDGFGFTSDTLNNAAKYVSPSWGGFSIEAMGALGEGGPRTAEVGLSYKAGPFKAVLTYHQAEQVDVAKDKLVSAGVSYSFSGYNARLAYSSADNQLSGTGTPGKPKAAVYDIGFDAPLGAVASASLDYVARDLKDSDADSAFIRLLLKYNLSKRTLLTANLIYMKNDDGASQSFYGLKAVGDSQTVVGAGISHSF